MKKMYAVLIVIGLSFASCTMQNQNQVTNENRSDNPSSTEQESVEKAYINNEYGIRMELPSEIAELPEGGDDASYLLRDSWNALDPEDDSGSTLSSFMIEGSNALLASGIRIGVSQDAASVQKCTASPEYASAIVTKRTIHGTMFTVIELGDAAMSKFQTISSYRAVKNNTCYVFDTYVRGTNPGVYENPPTPGFERSWAEGLLVNTMNTVRIED